MSHEKSAKPRYAETLLLSPFFLFPKTRKQFLTIQYADDAANGKSGVFHMDKSNARDIANTAQAETGKKVEMSEERAPDRPGKALETRFSHLPQGCGKSVKFFCGPA